jgi:IS30 family transposase
MGLQLIEIYEPSQLSVRKVYQIDSTLYRFLYKCPHSRSDHPKWCFEPLPGQRKTSTLKLNQNKVRRGIQEVPNMISTRTETATNEAIQQSLF